jgi:diacylglycerol kinase
VGFIKSLGHAVKGIRHVLKNERNARIHVVAAISALAIGVILGVEPPQLAAICFVILLVFLAELFNTVIEETLDLVDGKNNPKIKQIKDMTAGGVLIAAVGAIIVAIIIFWPYFLGVLWPAH